MRRLLFAACVLTMSIYIFAACAPTPSDLALNSVADGRIFQRNDANQYDLAVEGTYYEVIMPQTIQACVVWEGTTTIVVDWTTIEASPAGGVYSGFINGVPQGGWYQIQVRLDEDNETIITGPNKFGVGIIIACTGQSHIDRWFDRSYGAGAPPANDLTRMYRHALGLQAGPLWKGWQPVTGMGAIVFANKLNEITGVPVGLLDYGVQGASLWQSNSLFMIFGWWLEDDSGLFPAADNYAEFKAGLSSIDNKIETLLWIQGHTDAMKRETQERYKQGLDEILDMMRIDMEAPDLPIFISLVPRQGEALGPGTTTPDENIQAIRDAEVQKCLEDANTYLGCTTMDLAIRVGDNVHHTPESQAIQAERLAQAVLHVILDGGDYTYHRGPQIIGYEIVDATTIDIHITHSGGTDITPLTDIQGFEVAGTGAGELTNAARYISDIIRLTISGNTASVTGITYLYGGNPGDQDLYSFVSGYVHDNSPLALPLEGAYIEEIEW